MKKGFTLIELLAVIVILAIIAVIATPIVLNIIKGAKKSSNIRSAENYIHSLELSLTNNQLTSSNLSDGVYSIDEIDVEIDGKRPSQGYVQIEKGNIVKYNVKIDNQEVDSVEDYDIWKEVNVSGEVTRVIPDGNTYHITKASELAWIAQVVNDGTNLFDGKLISLEANLDLNNIEWTPIGSTSSTSFKGIFNGNNHVIKNIYINNNISGQGLFGRVYGDIKNIILINSYIYGISALGGIIGISYEPSNLENLAVYNSKIIGRTEDQINFISYRVGGVVGQYASTCRNLKSIANYIEASSMVGGIIGGTANQPTQIDKYLISKCYSDKNTIVMAKGIYQSSNYYSTTGGLVGALIYSNLIDCKSSAKIDGKYLQVGSLAGNAYHSNINNCTVGKCFTINDSKTTTDQYIGLSSDSQITNITLEN